MFELADKLVGIYKTHDVTQTITINPTLIWANIQATKLEKQEDEDKENIQQPMIAETPIKL